MSLKTASGQSVTLGEKLAAGGQGEIFDVPGASHHVAKLYFGRAFSDDPSLVRRLPAMVSAPPQGWRDGQGHVAVAWPTDVLLRSGAVAGFLMPAIDVEAAVELHEVANPSDRARNLAAGFTWLHLASVGRNLSRAVELLHGSAIVIGDFNERNILVHNDARVSLIDCDSMQVSARDGETFLCPVGRPEFTPPELLAADWRTTKRSTSSDLFALAIHLHQLLLQGEHPFRGQWHGNGEKPSVPSLARDGIWTFGGDRRLTPRNSTVSIAVAGPELESLFRRALVRGAVNPRERPTASEWRIALTQVIDSIQTCRSNPWHKFRAGIRCPWCAMETTRTAPAPRTTPAGSPKVPTLATTQTPLPPPPAPPPIFPRSPPTGMRKQRRWKRRLAGVGVMLALATGGAIWHEQKGMTDDEAVAGIATDARVGADESIDSVEVASEAVPIAVPGTAAPMPLFDPASGQFSLWPLGPKPVLEEGAQGDVVAYLQGVLRLRAGQDLEVDGLFGPSTTNAVRNLQYAVQAEPTGIVQDSLWAVIDQLAGSEPAQAPTTGG